MMSGFPLMPSWMDPTMVMGPTQNTRLAVTYPVTNVPEPERVRIFNHSPARSRPASIPSSSPITPPSTMLAMTTSMLSTFSAICPPMRSTERPSPVVMIRCRRSGRRFPTARPIPLPMRTATTFTMVPRTTASEIPRFPAQSIPKSKGAKDAPASWPRQGAIPLEAGLKEGSVQHRLLVGMEALELAEERVAILRDFRMRDDAGHRTDGHALGLGEVADALRAELGLDHVHRIPLADCLVRALRLARTAAGAFLGDE